MFPGVAILPLPLTHSMTLSMSRNTRLLTYVKVQFLLIPVTGNPTWRLSASLCCTISFTDEHHILQAILRPQVLPDRCYTGLPSMAEKTEFWVSCTLVSLNHPQHLYYVLLDIIPHQYGNSISEPNLQCIVLFFSL